jgi:TonB-linked SusC/RagA family outer membrane protein
MNFNDLKWSVSLLFGKGWPVAGECFPGLSGRGSGWLRGVIMRLNLIIFFLTAMLMQVSAISTAQITLTEHKAPLLVVIKSLKKQSGYHFFYNDQNLKEAKPVTVSLKNVSLEEALKACMEGQDLTYKIEQKMVVIKQKPKSLLDKVMGRFLLMDVKGVVRDEKGEALAGATVRVKGTEKVVMTGSKGEFVLVGVEENAVLVISYLGFESRELKAQNDMGDIGMVLASGDLDEVSVVVNTGYQSIPKERATGSFSTVDNALLNKRTSSNIIDRLEGNVPGLIFHKNTSASTDGGIDINIRGHSTLFANDQPLIVVDNFPYDGPLSNINPNDVESITVLRDAASASIWGVKAGNGVIVITTKKGAIERPLAVEFNSNLSIGQKPNLYYKPLEPIKATDRVDIQKMLYEQGYYLAKLTNTNFPDVPLAVSVLDKIDKKLISESDGNIWLNSLRGNDVRDDFSKYFYQSTVNQQYAINFKGGTKKSDYYLSGGYDNNRLSQVGFRNDRFNLTSNLNLYPTSRLSISASLNLTYANSDSNSAFSDLNSLSTMLNLPEYSDLVDNDTKVALPIIRNYNPTYLESLTDPGFKDWNYRPYDELRLTANNSKQQHNRVSLGINYKLVDGLSASLKYLFEKGTTKGNDYRSPESYYTRNLVNRFYAPNGTIKYPVPNDGGIMMERFANLNTHRARMQLDYNKEWKQDHEVSALVGAEINETVTDSRVNTLYGFNPENLSFVNVNTSSAYPTNPSSSSSIPSSIGVGKLNDRYISYFVNGSYTYSNKYTISGSGRIDKSNLFGVKTNQKAAPLYSVGISWDMSKESFYNLEILPNSKLRVTYGYSGNIDKSASAYHTFYTSSNSWYYGLPFAVIQRPGNDELRWEKVRTINLGYDFATKGNRVTGSVEFYFKKGIDLFGNSPIAGSSGFTVFYGNTAGTSTKGFDININSTNVNYKGFKWSSNLIASRSLDIVTSYDIKVSPGSYINGVRASIIQPFEGNPLFAVYSYPWAGLSGETGDPQGYIDGEISKDWTAILSNTTVENMVFNGPARPVHFGSLRNTFIYGPFSLSANILYKLNYYFRRTSIGSGALYAGMGHADYYKRWQKPGDELTTNVPSLQNLPVANDRDSFYANSETLIEKGDHIRLQDIMFSYNLDLKNKLGIKSFQSLQLFGNINNVGILWRANKYDIDPDVFTGSLPNPRIYSIGAKLLF